MLPEPMDPRHPDGGDKVPRDERPRDPREPEDGEPRMTTLTKMKTNLHLSKDLVIVKETRKMIDGISKGNLQHGLFNAGMLASFASSIGGVSSAKMASSFNKFSAGVALGSIANSQA